ncbi:MAG: hypothetical protein IIY21_23520, partial [Clostridiales bacterium]|nr:hypothetical protein [Clostridiales bacterium]
CSLCRICRKAVMHLFVRKNINIYGKSRKANTKRFECIADNYVMITIIPFSTVKENSNAGIPDK